MVIILFRELPPELVEGIGIEPISVVFQTTAESPD